MRRTPLSVAKALNLGETETSNQKQTGMLTVPMLPLKMTTSIPMLR